jgi:hypothetical protein
LGLQDRWAYYDAPTARWLGPAAQRIGSTLPDIDLLLNVSGVNPLRPWLEDAPRRVLIDTDPAFTQVRHLTESEALSQARKHTAFFSFGENFGRPGCSIPDDGLPWRPTRQPVVLDAWPVTPGAEDGLLTTVLQWDSYPPRTFGGRSFDMKSRSFEAYLDLPQRGGPHFELAVGSPTAPRALLRQRGWKVRDAVEVTRDPWIYQAYLGQSKGEFSVAKHGYVATWCGWFSERSGKTRASPTGCRPGRECSPSPTWRERWLAWTS